MKKVVSIFSPPISSVLKSSWQGTDKEPTEGGPANAAGSSSTHCGSLE